MKQRTAWAIGVSAFLVSCQSTSSSSEALPLARSPQELIVAPPAPRKVDGAVYWGTATAQNGKAIVLSLRDDRSLTVDMTDALKAGRCAPPVVGKSFVVNGTMIGGVLHARLVARAKGKAQWGPDVAQ
jgi:hypothetical protein